MIEWKLRNFYRPLKLFASSFLLRLEDLNDDAIFQFVAWISGSIRSTG